ncbi:hypothetical protein [Streptomyces sp. AK02-01A]|uniref:hypothetical protein n=1 Tax=Streptomyces sp. AK02-01A TaxID=3028648 RepID=UPI0029ADFD9F|nr:hypothetical protein [Streptomyces sp. AK02-01A]MDX3855693.1 hypothetical protein [Streptomyces sp. AK02-01A]
MVQTLAAAGELQRDLQRELTYDRTAGCRSQGEQGRAPPGRLDREDWAVRAA